MHHIEKEYEDFIPKRPTHDQIIKQIKEYVEKLNIHSIVDSILCEIVLERHQIGNDNSGYHYERITRLPDEYATIENDEYLAELLEIGSVPISGDTATLISPRGGVPYYKKGMISGDELQIIKQRRLNAYSKEEHLGYLFAEWHSTVFHNHLYKELWEKYYGVIEYALCYYFHLDELSYKHKKFMTNYRHEIDTIYLYDNRIKNVEIINDGIKKSTLCNLDSDEFDQFVTDLRNNVGIAQNNVCHYSQLGYNVRPSVWKNDRNTYYNYDKNYDVIWPSNK